MRTPTTAPASRGVTPPLASGGVTLLEVIIAMLIIGMVAAGVMGALVFSRRLSWRSATELSSVSMARASMENMRNAIAGNLPGGVPMAPGIWVDENMQNRPAGATPIAALNMPAEFARFQTDPGTAPTMAGHGDGRMVVVEEMADLDGDGMWPAMDADSNGQMDFDFDGDGAPDLLRVRVRVRWSSPEA